MLEHVKFLIFLLFIIFLICTAGCAKIPKKVLPMTVANKKSQPMVKPVFIPSSPSEGSLWTDSGEMFFVDSRARRVGDTVTVDIIENTSSSIDANTSASRKSGIDAGLSHALGYIRALEEKNRNFNLDDKLFQSSLENNFNGKGKSDRSGRVTASVGARVTEVLPNGNLVLSGSREMKVNNEVQYITVSGIIRPKDISSDNRIKSVYLSDARIEYYGKGVLADKQRPGWASRIVDLLWPF